MKKKFALILLVLLMPFKVLSYSDFIIPGGENIGIEINGKGVMVVGFYKVNGKNNNGNPRINIGDIIIKVDNIEVDNIDILTKYIKNKNSIKLTLLRDEKEFSSTLKIVDNKTGLYIKDTILGIGTLTYIDPNTKIFGTLGHEITENTTNEIVIPDSGSIFNSYVTGVDRSSDGKPGSKLAKFNYSKIYGSVYKNTNKGVFGNYNVTLPNKELIEVGDNAILGKASILTVLDNEEIKEYEIEIVKVNNKHSTKNIIFKITDDNLINKTGGILQGMSGSPIIQNNKIVGAVTHVIVDDVTRGYGIFITTMLEEGELPN